MSKEERERLVKEREEELKRNQSRQQEEICQKRKSFFSKRTQMEIDNEPTKDDSQISEAERALLKVSN